MNPNSEVWLVRHGQTIANKEKIWHGQIDTPLNEEGEQQRKQLGAHFANYVQPDVIVSSTLQRARCTAESIADQFGLDVSQNAALMEFYIGDWERQSYDALLGELGFFESMVNDEHYVPPGGESRADVTNRFTQAVEQTVREHEGKKVVIVAHGMAISFAMSHWLKGDSSHWRDYQLSNTSVSHLRLNPSELLKLNMTDHLND